MTWASIGIVYRTVLYYRYVSDSANDCSLVLLSTYYAVIIKTQFSYRNCLYARLYYASLISVSAFNTNKINSFTKFSISCVTPPCCHKNQALVDRLL